MELQTDVRVSLPIIQFSFIENSSFCVTLTAFQLMFFYGVITFNNGFPVAKLHAEEKASLNIQNLLSQSQASQTSKDTIPVMVLRIIAFSKVLILINCVSIWVIRYRLNLRWRQLELWRKTSWMLEQNEWERRNTFQDNSDINFVK